MQKLLMFCALWISFITINAQNCNLTFKGKIIDFHDNTPIIGASVHIINLNKYTTTSDDGTFEFNNLCVSKLTVEIKHIACETKRININLDKNAFKEITLEHHLEQLKEVVVATNTKDEKTSIEQALKKEDLFNFADKSLGDALKTISGVSSLNTGNSIVKPMIHGLHSSRLLLINNNVRLFDQEWGTEHAPNIDLNATDKIEVIKGANTLRFGSDAIGGLILIKPKRYATIDSLFGSSLTSFNTNGLGGVVQSELIKTYKSGHYFKVQSSFKKFGDFNAPNYNLTNTGLENANASLNFGFTNFEKGFSAYYSFVSNKIGILRASHIGNVNDLVESINSLEPRIKEDFSYAINFPRQQIVHHLAKIDAFKRYRNFGKLSMQLDFQLNRRKEFDLRRGELRNTPVIDLQLITTSLQADLEIDYFENLKVNTGLLIRYQNNNAIAGTGVSPIIPDFDRIETGLYVISNYNLNESTEVSAGFRYDFAHINATKNYNLTDWNTTYNYDELFPQFETGIVRGTSILTNPRFSFNNISANLGYLKKLNPQFNLLFNYGLAQRAPNPSEFFSDGLHHSAARIEIGLLNLTKETAHKFVVSVEKNNEDFGFNISPYYKYINNFMQLIPIGITTTIRGAFPVWQYNQVNARIFGVDIDINKKLNTHFTYNGNLSLLQGDNRTDAIPLIHMPSTNFTNAITYKNDQFHQLKLTLNQRTVLQQNRFPNYNFFTFNPSTQQDVFVDISSTPPSYTLFGLNAQATFHPFKKGSLEVGLAIENLFDVSYRENLNRLRFFADELGRNYALKMKLYY